MEGENSLKVYLALRRRVSSESIFFNGLVGFYGARLEASAISRPRALFHFFNRSLGMRFARPFTATSVHLTDFFIPISADEKGATSALGFWPII